MKKLTVLILFNAIILLSFSQLFTHWESRAPMPAKRSNMATASLDIGDTTWIFTFMGIDSTKSCGTGIRLESYKYNTVSDRWYQIASVPDTEGRIAASATGVNGKIFLIGGYKVFGNCSEFTSPRVDLYDPATNSWSQGDSIITPTDDHVQFLWRDSLIYTVSGWSQTTNTKRVQFYDVYQDTWTFASDISGPGLFGHCGSVKGDTILYLDGVRIQGFNFVLTNEVWQGVIDPLNPANITWTSLGTHAGEKVYRGGGFSFGDRILFTGGTNNAYNFNGIGYNAIPSIESGRTWGYHLPSDTWEEYSPNSDSVMDVREVVQAGTNHFYVIGGMSSGQTVTNSVSVFVVDSVLLNNDPSLSTNSLFAIGPNPTDGLIQLNKAEGILDWEVLQIDGRPIANGRLDDSQKKHLDLTKFLDRSGVYIIRILNDGKIAVRRIIYIE